MMASKRALTVLAFIMSGYIHLNAQVIHSEKQIIDKVEYAGLVVNQKIEEKELAKSWEKYLSKFGKVKSHKRVYIMENVSLPSISNQKLTIVSQVSTPSKNLQQVFASFRIGTAYISNTSDEGYSGTELFLNDFTKYATSVENVRLAQDVYDNGEKNHKKLERKNKDIQSDIEKADKKLGELKGNLEKAKADLETSGTDDKTRQKLGDKTNEIQKNIYKTEKRLVDFRADLEKSNDEIKNSQESLKNKQKALEDSKSRVQ